MKTKTINIYQYHELGGPAADYVKNQQKIRIAERDLRHAAMESIEALAKHFDVIIEHWSINWFAEETSVMSFKTQDMTIEDIEKRLSELGEYNPDTLRGLGDCKLTGYCMDESAIDGFRIAFHKLLNKNNDSNYLELLMQAAFSSWLKEVQEDCADFYKDEQFSEFCNVNNYWFTKDGEMTSET